MRERERERESSSDRCNGINNTSHRFNSVLSFLNQMSMIIHTMRHNFVNFVFKLCFNLMRVRFAPLSPSGRGAFVPLGRGNAAV